MGGEDAVRRPKRRCARSRSTNIPSAVHYVGYVEDDETPEMIMAKFAELERIKKAVVDSKKAKAEADTEPPSNEIDENDTSNTIEDATNPSSSSHDDQALSDEHLLEVFKQTSMFNVKTALQDNAMLLGIDEVLEYTNERYGPDDMLSDDDDILRSFWSDDEDWSAGEDDVDEYGCRRRAGARRRGSGGTGRSSGRSRAANAMRVRHNIVTAYNPDTQALVRRRVRAADPDEILQIRVPPAPIPLAWGRTVKHYEPEGKRGLRAEAVLSHHPRSDAAKKGNNAADGQSMPVPPTEYVEVPRLAELSLGKYIPTGKTFQAAVINPGWESQDGETGSALTALSKLPLTRLVPSGFVFIWTPKQHVHAVCKQMLKWGYVYIENLTWVYRGANHKVMSLPSQFVGNSHMTLYMFRMADKGKDIELRHQRNPDVTFDCLASVRGVDGEVSMPDETFVMVETLLPTGKGQLLELWAPRGVRRPGWHHVVERAEA